MADPYHHALSSARKWGGRPEDYAQIHEWFDATKAHFADPRHRAMRHHSEGIAHMIECFGLTLKTSRSCGTCNYIGPCQTCPTCVKTTREGRNIPTRWVGEQHVLEDFGFIPTVQDFLKNMTVEPWMVKGARKLSRELENEEEVRT